MMILSPSYKRCNGVLTHNWLPTRYCVHEFEEEDYRDAGHDVIVIPDDQQGNIAKVRTWMVKYAKGKGEKQLLIIDDDVRRMNRWKDGKNYKMESDEALEFIEMGFHVANEWEVPLWGIQSINDKIAYREYMPFSLTAYCSGSFHGLLDLAVEYDERFPLKEDFDLCIQLLNKYRKILRFNLIYMTKDDHKNLGGCSSYRTILFEKQQLRDLQKKWGKKIVKMDDQTDKRNRQRKKSGYDINPVMRVPIRGI